MKAISAVLFGLTITACASLPANDPAVSSCNPPKGWEAVAEQAEGRALFVVEIHGTNEIPNAFYRYVCAASARPGRTVVALEYSVFFQDAFDAALASDAPREELLKAMEPQWRIGDGRGSRAMFEMVLQLNALRKEGRDIDIRLVQHTAGVPDFDTAEERRAFFKGLDRVERQQMGDNGMAEKIAEASEGAARTIILMGNFHVRKGEIESMPGLKTVPMLTPGALSLIATHDNGTAWVMVGGGGGPHETGVSSNRPDSEQLAEAQMGWLESLVPAYDGYLDVGGVTASPPALPSQ